MSEHNVLIVDDDSNNLQLGINILKQNNNYNVIFATSGETALKRVKECDFDLILLDILMEPMDGYEVCKILKSDNATKDIPIIFLTAKDDEDSIVEGFNLGAVDYITKPFFTHELLSRVQSHLELKYLKDNLIKELKYKDNLLLQQNKMASMGEMLENIVHQWRKPLSMITTIASGAKIQKEMGMPLNETEELKMLVDITNSAEHLSQTVDDFRTFFQNKEHTLVKVDEIINKTLNLLASEYFINNITIIKNIDDLSFTGLDNELIQVLLNIISNAKDELKNIDDKKIIKIDAYREDNDIVITVQDNANGISDEVIDNIFDLYFTTKSEKDGTGIGLYMTKQIIDKHFKGHLKVENKFFEVDDTKYFGAKFTITISIS